LAGIVRAGVGVVSGPYPGRRGLVGCGAGHGRVGMPGGPGVLYMVPRAAVAAW